MNGYKTLHLKAHDLLVSTNRNTDGRGYEQLEAALDRLSGTRIKTNLKTNGPGIKEGFGLIDSWKVIRHYEIRAHVGNSDQPFGLGL